MNLAPRRESQGSLNSSASLDLGFLAFVSSKSEVSGPSDLRGARGLSVWTTASCLHGLPAFPADVYTCSPSLLHKAGTSPFLSFHARYSHLCANRGCTSQLAVLAPRCTLHDVCVIS